MSFLFITGLISRKGIMNHQELIKRKEKKMKRKEKIKKEKEIFDE